MNKVILMGRLTADPEVRYTGANNSAFGRFTLAVERRYKKEGGPDADFITCKAFNKTAEFLEKYGRKGIKFVIEGRIETDKYTGQDGKTIYTEDVIVENIEFAESKSTNQGTGAAPAPAPIVPGLPDGFLNIPDGIDEQLPFN